MAKKKNRGLFYGVLGVVFLAGLGVVAAQMRRPPRPQPQETVVPLAPSPQMLARAEEVGVVVGSPDAPVTVVEFMDYLCPYCGKATLELFPRVDSLYIQRGKVRWIFVDFPLPSHPTSFVAAVLARCGEEQGMFMELHKLYLARMREWGHLPNPTRVLLEWAGEAGADVTKLRQCFESGKMHDLVEQNAAFGRSLGVRATPTFFINGDKFEGLPRDLNEFLKVLDSKLSG